MVKNKTNNVLVVKSKRINANDDLSQTPYSSMRPSFLQSRVDSIQKSPNFISQNYQDRY